MFATLISAGTHCPVVTFTISPGTNSLALMVSHFPSLRVRLSYAYISTSASRALSAFESYQMATMPLMTRMSRITNGSTYAAIPSSPSSKRKNVSHEFQHSPFYF